MKILIVAPKFYIFPVGIAYISAALKHDGHKVDCCIFDKPSDLIKRLEGKYNFVATGGLSSQYGQLKNIISISKNAGTQVIAGGGIITSEPELMSRNLNVDYAILGEGEESVVQLLSTIENAGDLSSVNGIGYFKDGQFILTQSRKPIANLDALPWPDYEGFNFNNYLDSMKPSDQYVYDIFDYPREYPVITSRSCPFLCTFCYHPIGNKYRQRSVDSIMKELEAVIPKYRINIVAIYDELFSHDEERVYEFCRRFSDFIKTIPWEVKWFCQMRVNRAKKEMLEAMKEAGCFMVSYGFESYSPTVLKSMKKFISPDQIHQAVHNTIDSGISIQGNFIFGDKAETLQTAQETLNFWKDHLEAGILLGFIMPIPDSELYQYCIQKNIIKDKLDFIQNHLFDTFNMTSMPDAEFSLLKTLVLKYKHKYYTYTIPLKRTLTSMTIKCPHCQQIIEYKNFTIRKLFYIQMMYCKNCRRRFFNVSRIYKVFVNCVALVPFVYQIYLSTVKIRTYLRNIIAFNKS